MKKEKEFLKEKLIEFQLKIAELSHSLQTQEQEFQDKEKSLYLQLFEVLDAFENFNENTSEKEEKFDKTTRGLVKTVRSIQKKLIRILKENHIVPIEFPDNKAKIEYCKVADTRNVEGMENEEILSVVKKGYIDTEKNAVLRKAEVITAVS